MANPKQKIIASLVELEVLQVERDGIEAKRARQTKSHREAYERRTQPINEKFDAAAAAVNERIAALVKEIEAEFFTNTDADGVPKLKSVASETLKADVVQSAARREVSAESFFNFVPSLQRRGESFWNCFSVQIGKAEKFLGEKINEIASVKQSFKVVIRPK